MAGAPSIAIMDTTLRDGEQTPDVSYSPAEKRELARLFLTDVKVDRIEIASTRVSEGEREGARLVTAWAGKAGYLPRVEILGYCDGRASVDWITSVGGRALNLLTKGSERHCRTQLRKTPEAHRADVSATVRYAQRKHLLVNVYLEDWSQGVRESFDYVFALVRELRELGVERIYLPDTLGVLSPADTARFVGLMTATWPDVRFEFHAHNDYGLATANCLAAVAAGARGVHTSVNGLGERAGNTRLAEIVAALHDQTPFRTQINESRLLAVSRMVETFSGKDVASNSPIVGRDVFTQTAGIHADGDAKGDLYANALLPQRFGRERRYALGKLSGRASLDQNLRHLGIELPETDRDLVLRRIIELGDKKHTVTPDDLPLIIADVLKAPASSPVRVQSYRVTVAKGELPAAEVAISFGGRTLKAHATGDGGYDAFMQALGRALEGTGITLPRLEDFRVRIPPGGRTEALVETLITWRDPTGEGTFSTLGVDSDQMAAAVIATEKMIGRIARQQTPTTVRKPTTIRKPTASRKPTTGLKPTARGTGRSR
jgi:D-citramalate synthase